MNFGPVKREDFAAAQQRYETTEGNPLHRAREANEGAAAVSPYAVGALDETANPANSLELLGKGAHAMKLRRLGEVPEAVDRAQNLPGEALTKAGGAALRKAATLLGDAAGQTAKPAPAPPSPGSAVPGATQRATGAAGAPAPGSQFDAEGRPYHVTGLREEATPSGFRLSMSP